jgi:prepilin-type N-terminal cleavage/methylation domain-containing protein
MKNHLIRGFTLVELLTAITLFLAVSAIVFGASTSLIRYQGQMVTMQGIFNDSSYVLETMGRSIRMARRDASGSCISLGKNFENPGSDLTNIRFLDHDGTCRRFFLESGQIKEDTGSGSIVLTSSNHDIQELSFIIIDEAGKQPRVTIVLEMNHDSLSSALNLQTTVSQRNLNF